MRLEPGLRFFLRYVEAHGAEVLEEDEQAYVHLPQEIREDFALPEELALTSDSEVAQEGGQMLVIAGHPLLEAAAERVLQQGDAGWLALAWPRGTPPAEETLLAGLRAFYPVEHGRIDLACRPEPVYVPLLRIGALASFRGESQFLERIETCVDATEGLALPAAAARRALLAPAAEAPEAWSVLAPRFEAALGAGLQELEQRAALRAAELDAGAQAFLREELGRAAAYYAAQLQHIAKRREGAAPERQQLYDEQARVTAAEAARRRDEIEEKYRVRSTVRPFRLHLLLAPALHLELEVRRGERRYPLACNYLLEAQTFLGLRCPGCGEVQPLVAGRQELGCLRCQGARAEEALPPAQERQPGAAAAAKTPPARPPATAGPLSPGQRRAKPGPVAAGGAQPPRPASVHRLHMPWQDWAPVPMLAQEFFQLVLAGLDCPVPVARHSPLDIALRWFGWRGLHLVLDLPYPEEPTPGCRLTSLALIDGHHLSGRLHAGGMKREFTLLTQGAAEVATLWEVLPCQLAMADRLAPLMKLGHQLTALEDMARRQPPPSGLDDVEWRLLGEGSERWQFSLLLRAVSIWRRAGRKAAGISPRAAASGLFLLATDQSGLKAPEADVANTFGADPLRGRQAAEAIARRLPPQRL